MEISHLHRLQETTTTTKTTLEDLPEDVIQCLIISKLNLRDVVNFSSVSKQWTHVPACLQTISLDVNMFKNSNPEGMDAFVRGVNQFFKHYWKLRRSIEVLKHDSLYELVIRCRLGKDSSDDLDTWISMAVCNGVTNLGIFFDCEHQDTTGRIESLKDGERYTFPWRLVDKVPIVLNRLYLRCCIFDCQLTSVWTSLEDLQLCCTVLTQHDVDRILDCFPNLKRIVLGCSRVPKKLTFAGNSLYCLMVLYCTNLEEIEVLDAGKLEDFRYKGTSVGLKINNPRQLTTVTFGFLDSNGVDYIFQNLRRDFPAMKCLLIFSDRKTLPSLAHLYGQMYSFLLLEELRLYTHPNGGFSLETTGEILKACTSLRRLEMVPPCTVDDGGGGNGHVPPHPHRSLEFIKLSGFCGSPGNMEVAKFLIQAASKASLHLVIKRKVESISYYIYYKHSESWHGEQESQVIKERLLDLMKGRGELVFS